ncbi:MAG: hemolysin activation protein [Prevotella sp.]|nr:hemolysin activation protein [Prevotella sp.]
MIHTEQQAPAGTDVAVLLIFFTRTHTLQRTFDVIRKARPTKLLLYQDGPRNAEEAKQAEAARQIVADDAIDWPADVRRSYHSENAGPWASNYHAQRWAFSLYDKCVVLEDDSIPSFSFIPFCKELLDRYENDLRIGMIAGFNHEERTESPYDYIFTTMMPVWGWASWRRVVGQWDGDYSIVDDEKGMRQLETLVNSRKNGWKEMVKKMRKHKQGGQPIYETVFWSYLMLNSCLTIVPTKNMIHNDAVSAGSAHYQTPLKTLPRRMQQLLTMPSYEVVFPLRHPKLIMEDAAYKERVFRIMAWEHPMIKLGRSFEELCRNLFYGNFSNILSSMAHRVKKLTGRYDYR